jgi:uncharacterized YigZ family protein
MATNEFTYLTVDKQSEGFYKEKGSKFLAFAVPCTSEEEAKVYLNNWRKEHYQAVHVCYAFRFGSDKKRFRASDDGEPSNSAGPPILGQLLSFDVTDILVAVVRYYGGTNLGVGGLINAYRTAAKEALENATLIEREDENEYRLLFEYDALPGIMSILKQSPCKITRQDFQLSCELSMLVPVSNQLLHQQLTELNTQSPNGPVVTIYKNGISE